MDKQMLGLVGFIVAILIVGVVGSVGTHRTTQKCYSQGFPIAHYSLIGKSYCVKRVNQTDVMVPV